MSPRRMFDVVRASVAYVVGFQAARRNPNEHRQTFYRHDEQR